MLQYFQQLIQDAQETNWFTAKSAHKVLLIEMERGKISWKDAKLINQMRARYTQRTIHPGVGDKKSGKQAGICASIHLIMGLWDDNYFIDVSVAFGFKHGSAQMQRLGEFAMKWQNKTLQGGTAFRP